MEEMNSLVGGLIGFVVRSDLGYTAHVGMPIADHGSDDHYVRVVSRSSPQDAMDPALELLSKVTGVSGHLLEKIFTVPVPIPSNSGHWLREMLILQARADARNKKRIDVSVFDDHQIIGVDFDGTLIGHKYSGLLQAYILAHPEKNWHIVTFRSHGMQEKIRDDLIASTSETGVALSVRDFRGVHNIDDGKFEDHVSRKNTPDYYAWKAMKCAELGCTIMIDDLADWIAEDCVKANIAIVSPDDFDLENEITEETIAALNEIVSDEEFADHEQIGEAGW